MHARSWHRAAHSCTPHVLMHAPTAVQVRALRDSVKELRREYDKTEDDLKALQVAVCRGRGRVLVVLLLLWWWWWWWWW
jgi:hypothetical protein